MEIVRLTGSLSFCAEISGPCWLAFAVTGIGGAGRIGSSGGAGAGRAGTSGGGGGGLEGRITGLFLATAEEDADVALLEFCDI
ncbi:TPA: hypothetical protein ACQ31I_001510 [Yersinia enterocolitica]